MASGKYRVILSRRSDRMLIAHTEFLARISPAAARKLLAAFHAAASSIADDPLKYPYADDFDAAGIPREMYRKCIFYERYKALFLIDGYMVYIDAIIDCRQENAELY